MTTQLPPTMNLQAPVSTIMSSQLITVGPRDSLLDVKAIFDSHRIHHLPVVHENHLLGMISKTDLLHFIRGVQRTPEEEMNEAYRLAHTRAEEIMTTGLAKLDVNDKINVAVEVFKENLFHALPVIKDQELVGIITTFDIIRMLSDEDNRRIATYRS